MHNFGVVQHDALPESICVGLHQDIPLQVAESASTEAVATIIIQKLSTLLQGRMKVSDDLAERQRIPSHNSSMAALSLERLPCIVHDAGECVEIFGKASHISPKLGVMLG